MDSGTSSENIYNLVPRPPDEKHRSKRYQSKFKPVVIEEYFKDQFDHRTMGESKAPMHEPQDFLKKHSKEPQLVTGSTSKHSEEHGRKPPVPKVNETPIMGLKTSKNFVTQNAVDSIMSVSKKPQKIVVDTRKGDKFLLETSGLEVVYVKRKDYGKTPDYLSKRQEEISRAKQEYSEYLKEMQRRGEMYRLNEQEKHEMLMGLKRNWDDIYRQYQSLSVVVDTIPKKHRKEWLEKEMKELENDITLLESHQIVYVAE